MDREQNFIDIERLKDDPLFLKSLKNAIFYEKFPEYDPASPTEENNKLELRLSDDDLNNLESLKKFTRSEGIPWPSDSEINYHFNLLSLTTEAVKLVRKGEEPDKKIH